MNQLSLATHLHLQKKTLNFSTFVDLRGVSLLIQWVSWSWAKKLPVRQGVGVDFGYCKLVSNKNDSKRHIFRLCLQPKCNRQLVVLEHLYIPWLVMLRVCFREAPKRTLMISYRDSRKKVHPQPYTLTMIFSDVVLEHMLSETNTDRTVAMQTSHLQVIRIVTGKHNASLTSEKSWTWWRETVEEHFGWTVGQKTTKINRVNIQFFQLKHINLEQTD